MEKIYDVFISYRRDSGQDIARALQLGLENQGLRVFFDLEELRGGNFNEKLYSAIEQSKNVIFLLTDGACDRFVNEKDWCRLELEYALKQQINLVPVAPLGCPRSFPDNLPPSLEAMRELNIAVLDKNDLFKQTVHEIVANYLCDVELLEDSEKKEAEKVFLELVRKYKGNDGFIDAEEKADLENKAREFKISAVRREVIIQQVEQEFNQSSETLVSADTVDFASTSQYDVFISYRRDGGVAYARLMYDRLSQAGYSVSFDMDTLKNGNFNEELLKRVVGCKNFVILLSKDCFKRTLEGCKREDDWMRIELATALFNKKNIITVMLPGFIFPEKLPADIDAVRFKNGPKYDDYYLDNFYSKLMSDFLQGGGESKGKVKNNEVQELFENTLPKTCNLPVDQSLEDILGNDAEYCRIEAESFYNEISRLIPYETLKKIDEAWEDAEYNLKYGDNKIAVQRYLEVINYSSDIQASTLPFATLLVSDGIDTNKKTWFDDVLSKAREGNVDYQYGLGVLYSQGIGVEKNHSAAFRWFERAASQGYIKAITAVGAAYASGEGVEKNYSLAFKHLEQAAQNDDAVACERLGYLYLNGYGLDKQDYKIAVKFYQQAVEAGNSNAMVALGQMYENGQGGTADPQMALVLYKMAASKENPVGQLKMAQKLFSGEGVEVSYPDALNLVRASANQGNADAMALLGKAYADGLGIEADKAKAEELFRLALKNNSETAKIYLTELEAEVQYKNGMKCLEGQLGVERDYKQAHIWFEKAAQQGNAAAMEKLGFLYEHGLGGEFDIFAAQLWYEKASEKGNASAIANLASLLMRGDQGIERNYSKAMELAKKSASLWSASEPEERWKINYAFYCIAKMYDDGLGVEKNTDIAFRFYLAGAHNGNLRCAYRLGNIYVTGLGTIAPSEDNAKRWYAFCASQEKLLHTEDDWGMRIIGNLYYVGQGGVEQNYKMANIWYEKAANLGNISAIADVGRAYMYGKGVQKNIDIAIKYISMAAERGDETSQNRLSWIYYIGDDGIAVDYKKAHEWAIKAADNGSVDAMETLFRLYRDGNGVEKDEAKALEWLKKAAEKQNGLALATLGNCYENGLLGCKTDISEAIDMYKKSAEKKAVRGFYELGRCYWYGIGVKKEIASALEYLNNARVKKDNDLHYDDRALQLLVEIYYSTDNFSEQLRLADEINATCNKDILYSIGFNILRGKRGLEKNIEKGIECLTAAAERGHSKAQNSLGWGYYTGENIPCDMEKAFEWTMKAVKNGNPYGMETLFRMYRDGSGVKQDTNEAIVWLKRASDFTQEQSSPCAMSEMGECYEYGMYGIEKDELKAVEYYTHAARGNKCPGKYNLGRCFLRGIGTEKNISKGIELLTEASKIKDTDDHIYQERALRLLAEIYTTGESGTVDEKKANECLKKADELKKN